MDKIQDVIDKIHFTGKYKYTIEQNASEEEFIKKLDEEIDKAIRAAVGDTAGPIVIPTSTRHRLRWRLIRQMLIEKGMDPAELDEMKAAIEAATDEAVTAHEKRVDSFTVIK